MGKSRGGWSQLDPRNTDSMQEEGRACSAVKNKKGSSSGDNKKELCSCVTIEGHLYVLKGGYLRLFLSLHGPCSACQNKAYSRAKKGQVQLLKGVMFIL